MKKIINKILSIFMIFGLIVQSFVPLVVYAEQFEDGNKLQIGGNPTVNNSTFQYTNGTVTITKNDATVTTSSVDLMAGDKIVITLTPDEGYNAQLYDNSKNFNIMLTNNKYEFTVGHADEGTLLYTPSFTNDNDGGGDGEPTVEAIKFDFTINGESFTNVTIGDTLTVSNNFNMNSLDEFYVTKIAIEGSRTYEYAIGEYSLDLMDNQERTIFESHLTKSSDNYALLRVEAHSGDIQSGDIAEGKTLDDYFGFYITNLSFIKEAFKGVEVSTSVMPDNYDFTLWNGADLSGTTNSNPGIVTAYYGENTISFNSITSSAISKITLADDSIPSSAVSINNQTGKVTILSSFYNKIPLKITLADGTIGYITVNRVGIYIDSINAGNDTFYHGAFADVNGNMNVDTDKNRIAAVFYHEDGTTYEDYNLIANLTFADGTTKTVIAKGIGDNHNSSGDITGSNYVIWSGDKEDEPISVSVTAVKKGNLSNDSTSFDGATFGAGLGVTWKNERREG